MRMSLHAQNEERAKRDAERRPIKRLSGEELARYAAELQARDAGRSPPPSKKLAMMRPFREPSAIASASVRKRHRHA